MSTNHLLTPSALGPDHPPFVNLDVPIPHLSMDHDHPTVASLTCIAKRGEHSIEVVIRAGWSRRTDGSIRCGSHVWPKEHPELRWSDAYPILGTCFGQDLHTYIAEGVEFRTHDGRAVMDDTTTAIMFAVEDALNALEAFRHNSTKCFCLGVMSHTTKCEAATAAIAKAKGGSK